jgi:hypothetical protein
MNRKVSLSILLFLVFSITSIGTYSFLVNKSTNPNVVSTGNFPARLKVKLYAASGAVFKENTPGNQNQMSISYPGWLDDASKYILKNLMGQDLNTSPANTYETYKNIVSSSNTTSRKQTIVSANFYSWEGKFLGKETEIQDDKKELRQNGTVMHHIIAFENSKRLGDDSPKLKLDDLKLEDITVGIKQYDVFTGMKSKAEYVVERPNTEFNLGAVDNRTRVRTFDYIQEENKYVQTTQNDKETSNDNQGSNGVHPAAEADLIIFDIGGEGYYTHPSEKSDGEQLALDEMFERLCGRLAFEKNQQSNPFDSVMDTITAKEDGLARLDRSVSEITLKKNGTGFATEENTIYFSRTE